MRISVALAIIAVVAAACSPETSTPTTTGTAPAQPGSTLAASPDPDPVCAGGDAAFRSSGLVAALGSDEGDARTVSAIRVERTEGCERLLIDFLSAAGAPASSVGPAGVTLIAESGDLRITLPSEVVASAVADAAIDSVIIEHIYVVDDGETGFVVDVHLNPDRAILASAFDTTSPAGLVVELRDAGDGSAVLSTPRRSNDIVLLSPGSGPGLYPILVTGYARPGTDSVRVRLSAESGIVFDEFVPTNARAYVWEGFRLRIDDGPSGEVDLIVDAIDPDGRTADGVAVPLDLP
jgi:hypothetical protein